MSKRLAERVKETMIKEEKLFDIRQGDSIPILLIIDRTCDPITPLLSQVRTHSQYFIPYVHDTQGYLFTHFMFPPLDSRLLFYNTLGSCSSLLGSRAAESESYSLKTKSWSRNAYYYTPYKKKKKKSVVIV